MTHMLRYKMDRYFTKDLIISANMSAIKEKRSKQLNEDYLEKLPDGILLPIRLVMCHEDDEMRVEIYFGNGIKGLLDLHKDRFESLPLVEYAADGSTYIETEDMIYEHQPYPKGREWITVTRKVPLRDSKFRSNVLRAYNYMCAMCDESNEQLLVAAHIAPVYMCADDSTRNGMCLCKKHDKLYEDGQILVSVDGQITKVNALVHLERTEIRYPENLLDYPAKEHLNARLQLSNKKKG